jgi:1-acyl-sn-glycerol-3-phosphate acyltransferase
VSNPVIYPVLRSAARRIIPLVARVEATGLEHLPRKGGALLLPNHQSALDPFLVQAWTPRTVRSMTKSTQFGSPFMEWILPRLGAFPVRRFRIDPQSVRTVLSLMEDGECVCIYPEGERSWDARLQPFRRGTLRTALEAMRRGMPVIPVGIDGMYDLLPRWGSLRRPQRPVHLRFGPRLELGPFATRVQRNQALPDLALRLRESLLDLSGERERERRRAEAPEIPWDEWSA